MNPARRRPIPAAVGRRVRAQARYRCGYCLCSETLLGMPMDIEHLQPHAAGGSAREENLWLACRRCNLFKGRQTQADDPESGRRIALFNPRLQVWSDHFAWSEDGTEILGTTACGRATVVALKLNNPEIVVARRQWCGVGWWPPPE